MILVDTSVWIAFLRIGDQHLTELLKRGRVLRHPWVQGELLLGRFDAQSEFSRLMSELPCADSASHVEMIALIQAESLGGSGIGYVDAQLIASARLMRNATVWTHDKRLSAVCDRMGISFRP